MHSLLGQSLRVGGENITMAESSDGSTSCMRCGVCKINLSTMQMHYNIELLPFFTNEREKQVKNFSPNKNSSSFILLLHLLLQRLFSLLFAVVFFQFEWKVKQWVQRWTRWMNGDDDYAESCSKEGDALRIAVEMVFGFICNIFHEWLETRKDKWEWAGARCHVNSQITRILQQLRPSAFSYFAIFEGVSSNPQCQRQQKKNMSF